MDADIYAVTDEERKQYRSYIDAIIRDLLSPRPQPPRLWYYTTATTFARIVQTKEVWSTQISCLNDHSEFRYAVRLLRKEFKTFFSNPDEDVRGLAHHVYELLADDGANQSWFFVICMSAVPDDLSQWRAYGGGEGGVCIGLDPRLMMTPEAKKIGGYLVPVLYKPNEQKMLVKAVANATMGFFKDGLERRPNADRNKWTDSFLTVWRDHVIGFAPMLKDSSFYQEDEWRLICSLSLERLPELEIQQRSSLIARHWPISFGDALPIREVVVGPCRHPAVSRVSVGAYLQAKGYAVNNVGEYNPHKVTVSWSAIPFRRCSRCEGRNRVRRTSADQSCIAWMEATFFLH